MKINTGLAIPMMAAMSAVDQAEQMDKQKKVTVFVQNDLGVPFPRAVSTLAAGCLPAQASSGERASQRTFNYSSPLDSRFSR
jgi:hypothetical protein